MSNPKESDRSSREESTPDPASLKALLTKWWELIVAIAGIMATLLTTLGLTSERAKIVGYGFALALVATATLAFLVNRRRKALKAKRELNEALKAQKKTQRPAFRGLYPYDEQDELPGEDRRQLARSLFANIGDSNFTYAVVCGEVGSGKTSLLRSAVRRQINETGRTALYIADPRTYSRRSTGIASSVKSDLARLKQKLEEHAGSSGLVVIIDQFEEILIEDRGRTGRAAIGKFLKELMDSQSKPQLLLGLRRDYLLEMHELAKYLPEPINQRTLFPVSNFSIEEASQVISECAGRDGVEASEEFALTVAGELAEGGLVRPTELQIVCTSLKRNLTMKAYRLSGGAKGIVSSYVNDAIAICSSPGTGKRILRALCDFKGHGKALPMTAIELRRTIVGSSDSQAQANVADSHPVEPDIDGSGIIQEILKQFERDRIVTSVLDDYKEHRYTLIHDYLVDAIALATAGSSTLNEKANQLLEYYRTEYIRDRSIRIPWRKLNFIKRNADKARLDELQLKRLIKASRLRQAAIALLLASVAVLPAATFVYIRDKIANTERLQEIDADKDLVDLESRASGLWPGTPDKIEHIDQWLGSAGRLPKEIGVFKDRLTTANNRGDLSRAAFLASLTDRLDGFLNSPEGTFSRVMLLKTTAVAIKDYEERTDVEEVWGRTIAEIGKSNTHDQYSGFAERIPYLVPIGQDPTSKLFEFANILSGDVPKRRADGTLIVTAETGLIFVLIPGGSFIMGAQHTYPHADNFDLNSQSNESPTRRLTLKPFLLSKYEITQGQWLRLTGTNPSQNGPQKGLTLIYPVDTVSWNDCSRTLANVDMSLPTEAQWEYAARAGGTSLRWNNESLESLSRVSNVRESGKLAPAPIGSYPPNAFGLHDLVGNLWEWCRDEFGSYELPTAEGDGERVVENRGGLLRTDRGGSYFDNQILSRLSAHYAVRPDYKEYNLGVRPAILQWRDVKPGGPSKSPSPR